MPCRPDGGQARGGTGDAAIEGGGADVTATRRRRQCLPCRVKRRRAESFPAVDGVHTQVNWLVSAGVNDERPDRSRTTRHSRMEFRQEYEPPVQAANHFPG